MEVRCPSCQQMKEFEGNPDRPFCSEFCKRRDLGNWASERYRVPVEEADSGTTEKREKHNPEEE